MYLGFVALAFISHAEAFTTSHMISQKTLQTVSKMPHTISHTDTISPLDAFSSSSLISHTISHDTFELKSTTVDTITSTPHDSATSTLDKKRKSSNTKFIACSSTKEVTRAIEMFVREGDVVAELGSQLRESSRAICESIGSQGKALLIDMERKFPNEKKDMKRTSAMRRKGDECDFYSDRATFIEIQSFELWRHALFFQQEYPYKPQYNVLVVDMSTTAGNDLPLTCIALIKEFIALNNSNQEECRAVIVKSGSLQNLAQRLYHAQRVISAKQPLSNMRHKNGGHSLIIGAVGVKQYRETIPYVVQKGDICLELGCHLGVSSAIIDKAAKGDGRGGCLGVDIGKNIICKARERYPNLSFEVGDGFKLGELQRMQMKHFQHSANISTYDVVYVDIGGLSGSEGLLEAISLLSAIDNCLHTRAVVIKSLCIRRLASSLIPFSQVGRHEERNSSGDNIIT